MKSFREVQDEYRLFQQRFPDDPTPLTEFAKQLDQVEGVQDRAEAYTDAWYKRASATVDRGFHATGLPKLTGGTVGALGSGFDSLFGTNIEPTVRRIGEDLPRMTAESIATIPAAVSGVGAPAAAAVWANRIRNLMKVAGYGSAGLQGYAQTDSPLGGLASAASIKLGNKLLLPESRGGIDVAGKTAGALRKKLGIAAPDIDPALARDVTTSLPQIPYDVGKSRLAVAGGAAAEGATLYGLNEATRQAQLSVGPNAVGPFDPARNPVASELVAGNVVGMAPFAVQAGMGIRSAMGFDPNAAKPLRDWIQNRARAVEDLANETEGAIPSDVRQGVTGKSDVPPTGGRVTEQIDLKTELERPTISEKDVDTLTEAALADIEAAQSAEMEGRSPDAQRNREHAAEILMSMGKTEESLQRVPVHVEEIKKSAEMGLPSTDQKHFVDFVREVNQLIDVYNSNFAGLAEGRLGERDVNMTRNVPEQTSHPTPGDPLLVQQLQEKGYLPRITPEWLQSTFSDTMSDLGESAFTNRVFVQKVANHLLDNLPDALKRRADAPPGEVASRPEFNTFQQEQKAEFLKFAEAIGTFHPAVQRRLIKKMRGFLEIEDFKLKGQDVPPGIPSHRAPYWMRAVIKAAETYDPATKTIELRPGKREPLAVLWRSVRGAGGEFKRYVPALRVLTSFEGGKRVIRQKVGHDPVTGKPKYKMVPEQNIEGLQTPENVARIDEEDFDTIMEGALRGESPVEGEAFSAEDVRGAGAEGSRLAPIDEAVDPAAMKTSTEIDAVMDNYRKALPTITPEQAWEILRPAISSARNRDFGFQQRHAKTIIDALPDLTKERQDRVTPEGQKLIEAWNSENTPKTGTPLEQLQKIFGVVLREKTPLEGVSETTVDSRGIVGVKNPRATMMGRAKLVVERVLNPKTRDVTKEMAASASENDDGIYYRGQSRLGTGDLRVDPNGFIWFTKIPDIALSYAGGKKSNVRKFRFKQQNLFDVSSSPDKQQVVDFIVDYHKRRGEFSEENWDVYDVVSDLEAERVARNMIAEGDWTFFEFPGLVAELKRRGYNGIVTKAGDTPQYALFNPDHAELVTEQTIDLKTWDVTREMADPIYHGTDIENLSYLDPAFLTRKYKLENITDQPDVSYFAFNPTAAGRYGKNVYKTLLDRDNIKLFDVKNPEHLRKLRDRVKSTKDVKHFFEYNEEAPTTLERYFAALEGKDANSFNYEALEASRKLIKELGFDGYLSFEHFGGEVALFDTNKLPKLTLHRKLTKRLSPQDEIGIHGEGVFKAQEMAAPGARFGTTATGDLLTGIPPAGQFAPDVLRTISAVLDNKFGGKGYSGDLRDMYHGAAMAVLMSMKDAPVDFFKLKSKGSVGTASLYAEDPRGIVGVQVDPAAQATARGVELETREAFIHRVLTTLTHELAHIDDFIHFGHLKAPDAYSEERARQLKNIRSMYGVLDPDQRRAILLTLSEGLSPPKYRIALAENATQLSRAMQDVDEFSATVMTLVTQSLLFGKTKGLKTALETLDHSPIEIQEYAQFQFRAIRDVLQGLEDTLRDPSIRAAAGKDAVATGDPFTLGHAFHAVAAAAIEASRVRDGAKDVAAAREMVKALLPGAADSLPAVETAATWERRQNAIAKNFGEMADANRYARHNSVEAMEMAAQALGVSFGKAQKPGLWMSWFAPFAQVMWNMERSGVELAKPLADVVMSTPTAIKRRYSRIVAPFLKMRKDGTLEWDKDQPLVRNHSPKIRQGIKDVSIWQLDNGGRPMFRRVEDQLVVDTAARPEWEKIRKRYSPEEQQIIQASSLAMDEIHVNMKNETLTVLQQMMGIRAARMLQTIQRGIDYNVAAEQGMAIVSAYLNNTISSLAGFDPKVLDAMHSFLGSQVDPTTGQVTKPGLIAEYHKVKALMDARPGHRTESLPGDWIVMFEDAEGKTKYASAPTEKQARTVLQRAVDRGGAPLGEVLHRKDLQSAYHEFDDPDALISKFAKVEQARWQDLVEGVRKNHGDALADELAEAYTPGVESLRDLQSQGFRKFLKERKSKVDRESLDYIDAMFARAARLSASASYTVNGGFKDLILNDQRAKLHPTLRTRVNEHWDNMLAPIGETAQTVRALATGYFLAGNLSSAAVEGTQAITTVVPVLIATNEKGGPVHAYKQLYKAISAATHISVGEKWKTLAAKVEQKLAADPSASLTLDEARAYYYRQAVTDKLIGHGVVEDLIFSRDEHTLRTAKFGEGDYGPVSVGKFATNKLYLATQALMSIYSVTAKYNDKIAFFAGLDQGFEKGLRGNALYSHARQFKYLTTFGGGKTNAPGYVSRLSNVHTRPAIAMVHTLQQYGFGLVSLYAQLGKDMFNRSKELTPQQQRQAAKAFTTMLATQTALAGVLGVPFAGAALTMIEKATGVPAQQMVREGIASLSEDDEEGGIISEVAMNGLANQMFGLDVSGRLGVGNLIGTSAYRGFAVQDLLGPTPSILTNAVRSLNWFGQNETWKGARELVPATFKNVLAMGESQRKYGDYGVRDLSENLVYTPTDRQNIARLFGFRSRQEALRKDASHAVRMDMQRERGVLDRERDNIARELLNGNAAAVQRYAQGLQHSDPTVDTRDVLRSVVERAVGMTQEKDLLAQGLARNAESLKRTVASFGPEANVRQSEVALTKLRTQMAVQLGAPEIIPTKQMWDRAIMIDMLVKERDMTRSQASALVSMLGL